MPLDDTTNYWIARGTTTFGPYTGAQVREYVASGNIVPSDLIRAELDTDWTPVAVALGMVVPSVTPPGERSLEPLTAQHTAAHYAEQSAFSLAYYAIGLGLGGLACCCFTSPIALVFGALALQKATPASRHLARLGMLIACLAIMKNISDLAMIFILPLLIPPELQSMFGTP